MIPWVSTWIPFQQQTDYRLVFEFFPVFLFFPKKFNEHEESPFVLFWHHSAGMFLAESKVKKNLEQKKEFRLLLKNHWALLAASHHG